MPFHTEGNFVRVFDHTQDRSWSPLDSQTDTSGIAYMRLPFYSLSSLKEAEATLDGEIEIS